MPLTEPSSRLNRITVLILAIGISLIFYTLIKGFFMALLLAAIFAGLLYGINDRLAKRFGGRRLLATLVSIILFTLIIIIPLTGFMILLVDQAINLSKNISLITDEAFTAGLPDLTPYFERYPQLAEILPDQAEFADRINSIIVSTGNFIVKSLSNITTGTVNFFFQLFIFYFALFYFLLEGKSYLKLALYYLPLSDQEERMLLNRFTTVTRATLKGTLIIGLVQGTLAGAAMAVAGLPNALFWGVIMVLLSAIPAVGPAIVWFPASVYLLITGNYVSGIGLLLFGAIVVSSVDNLLRPPLVGKDTKMPDLMVLLGTLGGLAVFGMAGLIIGPIIAALFISIWEIYGETFREHLHTVLMFEEEKAQPEPALEEEKSETGPPLEEEKKE